MGRRYLKAGSSKKPSPQLAGHSDFSLVEMGMELGADFDQKPLTEEPTLLPTQERLVWEPTVSRGL